jgi:hypothetical protein
MNAQVPEEELLVAVDVLRFVADLCACQPEEMNVALCRFTSNYYPATHLRAEAIEVADRLAQAMGFLDASMEPAP